MPKINDLTNRPGGPQPTDEFWLASAGAAADFKSTIEALAAAVLGSISVVGDADATCYRIPGVNIQIAVGRSIEVTTAADAGQVFRSTEVTMQFEQPFSAVPNVTYGATYSYTSGVFWPPWAAAGVANTTTSSCRAFLMSPSASTVGRVTYLAIGPY